MHGHPHKHRSILYSRQTLQKMTLATQRVVTSSVLLSLVIWLSDSCHRSQTQLEIICWLLEFDRELQLNGTKNNILKIVFC